jgi:hypothetical protein
VRRRIMEMDFKQFGPLDEIADVTRSLTYGEMIDFAAELWKAAGGTEITAKTLPAILHQWASESRRRHRMLTSLTRPDQKNQADSPGGVAFDEFPEREAGNGRDTIF